MYALKKSESALLLLFTAAVGVADAWVVAWLFGDVFWMALSCAGVMVVTLAIVWRYGGPDAA